MTEKETLIARGKELGADVDARMSIATIKQRIADAEPIAQAAANDANMVPREGLPEAAESLPVEVTTEPAKVEANEARFDEDHSEAGAVAGDAKILNPGEQRAPGGNQDPAFTEASRKADASSDFAGQMVTNVEARIVNEPAKIDEGRKRSTRYREDHLAERGTGAGGPAGSVG